MSRPITALAFDYGTRHLGLAIGQTLTATANPLSPLKCRDGVPNWEEVGAILAEWKPDQLVVGLPLNMDGSESEMSRRAQKFANRLHGRFGLQVACVDERLTSFEAKSRVAPGSAERQQGGAIDSLAAVVILEAWLAARN